MACFPEPVPDLVPYCHHRLLKSFAFLAARKWAHSSNRTRFRPAVSWLTCLLTSSLRASGSIGSAAHQRSAQGSCQLADHDLFLFRFLRENSVPQRRQAEKANCLGHRQTCCQSFCTTLPALFKDTYRTNSDYHRREVAHLFNYLAEYSYYDHQSSGQHSFSLLRLICVTYASSRLLSGRCLGRIYSTALFPMSATFHGRFWRRRSSSLGSRRRQTFYFRGLYDHITFY
jgi:hypothetical protein